MAMVRLLVTTTTVMWHKIPQKKFILISIGYQYLFLQLQLQYRYPVSLTVLYNMYTVYTLNAVL